MISRNPASTKSGEHHYQCRPVRPLRWYDYIRDTDWVKRNDGRLWKEQFRPLIPLAIVDPRLVDLARSFWDAPGASLDSGYRRLEGVIRQRTGLNDYGAKLLSAAFRGQPPILKWNTNEPSEQEGRASLFVGAFMAYRNPRAHHELEDDSDKQLHEFLLLNHLFALEALAVSTIG